jgi:hypothetical protein
MRVGAAGAGTGMHIECVRHVLEGGPGVWSDLLPGPSFLHYTIRLRVAMCGGHERALQAPAGRTGRSLAHQLRVRFQQARVTTLMYRTLECHPIERAEYTTDHRPLLAAQKRKREVLPRSQARGKRC